MSEEKEGKIIDFFEGYAQRLYPEVEKAQKEMNINANSKHYRTFESLKNDLSEVPLNLLKLMKDDINDDRDIAGIVYLAAPHYFVFKEDRYFLAEHFKLTPKEIKKHARYLKRKIVGKLGEDWVAKICFPSEYGIHL